MCRLIPVYPRRTHCPLVIDDSQLGFILTTEQVRAALPGLPLRVSFRSTATWEAISALSPASVPSSVTEKKSRVCHLHFRFDRQTKRA